MLDRRAPGPGCRVLCVRRRQQLHERRLDPGLFEHHGRKQARHLVQNRLGRAVVHHQAFDAAAFLSQLLDEVLVGGEVRVAPAVDRLLRVAHQKEPRALLDRSVEGEPAHDVALNGVRVLELVHQELVDAQTNAAAHTGIGSEQRPRVVQQGPEGLDAARAHRTEHLGVERQQHLANRAEPRDVHPAQVTKHRAHRTRPLHESLEILADRAIGGFAEAPLRLPLLQAVLPFLQVRIGEIALPQPGEQHLEPLERRLAIAKPLSELGEASHEARNQGSAAAQCDEPAALERHERIDRGPCAPDELFHPLVGERVATQCGGRHPLAHEKEQRSLQVAGRLARTHQFEQCLGSFE